MFEHSQLISTLYSIFPPGQVRKQLFVLYVELPSQVLPLPDRNVVRWLVQLFRERRRRCLLTFDKNFMLGLEAKAVASTR